jgi:hypothetical protein
MFFGLFMNFIKFLCLQVDFNDVKSERFLNFDGLFLDELHRGGEERRLQSSNEKKHLKFYQFIKWMPNKLKHLIQISEKC